MVGRERGELVVDANSGLGEAVVSGLVTPDHYVLDGDGAIRERTLGRREVVVRSATGGGVTHSPAAEDGERLPEAVLAALAALGRSVEAHFGAPQDVEWAYADGKIWLVQARPMTALPPPPLHLTRLQRAVGVQLMDYVTLRPYPFDVSAGIQPGVGWMVSRMLGEVAGVRVDLAAMLAERDGIVERFVPILPRPTRGMLTAPVRIVGKLRRFDLARWTADPRWRRFHAAKDELDHADLPALEWAELMRVPGRALDAMGLITDLRVDYFPAVGFALLRLRVVLMLLGRVGLFPLLITGAHTRTDDTNQALEALAAQVRADPRLRAAFADLDPPALLERIDGDFADAFAAFLAEYGHRETTSPLLVSEPTWGDAPATVLGLVGLLVEQPPAAAGPDPGAQAERRLLDHRLVTLTRSADVLRRRIAATRAGIAFREDTHFYATAALPVLRRVALECGRRLVEVSVLRDAAEVLHLRLEELEGIQDPAAPSSADDARLRGLVRRRSAQRAELVGVPLISTAELYPPSQVDADFLVSGVGASGGRATGPVRVIRGPDGFATLRTGEVLVCPYTNPAWTPLFQRAAAVVVDSGGLGSHAAIVAREYGIPAVMATVRGTAELATGQRVTVDGDTGRVSAA